MIQFRQEWVDDVSIMNQEMGRLLDHLAAAKPPMVRFSPTTWEPAIDLYETDEQLVLTVDAAGIKESDLHITVDRNVFTIRGERRKALPGNRGGIFHQMEIASGPFERSIALPTPVDAERATATYENGIVEIVLPKTKTERTIRVEVKGG